MFCTIFSAERCVGNTHRHVSALWSSSSCLVRVFRLRRRPCGTCTNIHTYVYTRILRYSDHSIQDKNPKRSTPRHLGTPGVGRHNIKAIYSRTHFGWAYYRQWTVAVLLPGAHHMYFGRNGARARTHIAVVAIAIVFVVVSTHTVYTHAYKHARTLARSTNT